jgi:hypothetical protein
MGIVNAPCCSLFSVFAIAFLLLLSVVLSTSSKQYIRGIDDNEEAISTLRYAAALYGGTLALSLVFIVKGKATAQGSAYGRMGRGSGDGVETRSLMGTGTQSSYGSRS